MDFTEQRSDEATSPQKAPSSIANRGLRAHRQLVDRGACALEAPASALPGGGKHVHLVPLRKLAGEVQ